MCASQRALKGACTPAPLAEALNHQIIGFMSVTHVEIIANVPRVTSGKVCNGAIYKFLVVIHGKYPGHLLAVILWLLIKAGQAAQQLRRPQLLKSILLVQTLLLLPICCLTREEGLLGGTAAHHTCDYLLPAV